MNNLILKTRSRVLAIVIAMAMVLTLIPSTVAVHADTDYTFQPAIAEGAEANSLFMIEPSDISVLEETDTYILNQINSTVDGKKDVKFTFTMSAGMNNFNEANFLKYNMPIIKILDSNGNIVAQYSNGLGELKFLGSAKSDQVNNWGGQKTVELYIGVDEGVLATGNYTIVFGKDLCGNNITKVLGKEIRFNFFLKATSDLDVFIGEVQAFLDSAEIGDEPGQYPQSAADELTAAIATATEALTSINAQLEAGTITADEGTVQKNNEAKILDTALRTFKASRIVDVQEIAVSGISDTQYVGDKGTASAAVTVVPDEAEFKKVKWEASENIQIDEVTGEWLAMYAGKGWIRAVSKTDTSVSTQVDVDVVNEGNTVGVMLSSAAVAPVDAIRNAYGSDDLSAITSLKLFTTGSGYLDKDGVTAIHEAMPELATLDIENVSLDAVGNSWFAGWDKLETVILPENLTTIDIQAFYNCKDLKKVEIPVTVSTISSSAFAGCTALDSTMTVMAANPPSFATAVFEDLGYGDSFKGCSGDSAASVTTIKVPYGCEADYRAASGWKRYKIVEMEEKALTVSYDAAGGFAAAAEKTLAAKGWGDDEVTSIKIICNNDAEIEKITDMAYLQTHFLGATVIDLTEVNFPNNNIQSKTFMGRTNVKEFLLPEGLTHMGKSAFYGCTNLRTMTIPSTVQYKDASNPGIGESSLGGCDKLKTLIFLPAVPPGYLGSLPTGLEVVYVPNLSVADYQEEFSDLREIIKPQASVSVSDTSVEAMKTLQMKANVDSVVPVEDLKWETVGQSADNPVAVINEKTGVLTACRYGTVKVKVTAGYGTMNECSDTCTVTVTKAPAVSLTAARESYNKIKLSWSAMTDAEGYQIFRATSKDGSYSLQKTVTAKSYTDTGLITGKYYYYKVRGYKTVNGVKVYGDYSAVKSAKPYLTAPTAAAKRNSYNSIKVSWKAVDGANGYKVYRATSANGTYSEIVSTDNSTLTYTDTGLTVGKTYYYKVSAYRNIDNSKVYSAKSDAVSAKSYLTTPSATAKRNSYNSIKVSWNGISGATGYKIYRATSKSGKYSLIATKGKDVRSYVDTKRTTGKTYYYKVRAYRTINDSPVYSAYSAVKSAVPTLSKVSTVKTAKAGPRKIKVTWSSVSGATGYKVYRSTKKTSGFKVVKTVKAGKTRAYTSGKLTKNKKYYFKVRAYRVVNGKTVYGPYSSVVYRTAK